MKRRIKIYVILPAAIVIYALVMGVMSYPRYRESGNWSEFALIMGVCLVIAVLLYFILKRKQHIREKFKNLD